MNYNEVSDELRKRLDESRAKEGQEWQQYETAIVNSEAEPMKPLKEGPEEIGTQ